MKKFSPTQLLQRARRRYSIARGVLADTRKAAKAGSGVVTAREAREIKKREAAVAAAFVLVQKRKTQIGAAPRIIRMPAGTRFTYPWGTDVAPTMVVGHYTAGPRAKDAAALRVEAERDHHAHAAKGWGGLSYDFMIADDGTILLGNPANRKSAAVASHNTGIVNVCFPGTTGDRPTPEQAASYRWLLANAHTDAIPATHRCPRYMRTLPKVGHNDLNSTACPGLFKPMIVSGGTLR